MTSKKNTEQNDGLVLIVLLIFCGLIASTPPRAFSNVIVELERIKYNILRIYGVQIIPSDEVLFKELQSAADKYHLERSIFIALVKVESNFNPKAVSHRGARGIAQIMPANASRCGLQSADELFDVKTNLLCGAQILSEELQQHKNIYKALTVYNCGRVKCLAGQKYAKKVINLSKKYGN